MMGFNAPRWNSQTWLCESTSRPDTWPKLKPSGSTGQLLTTGYVVRSCESALPVTSIRLNNSREADLSMQSSDGHDRITFQCCQWRHWIPQPASKVSWGAAK